jgi:hypothetical protein
MSGEGTSAASNHQQLTVAWDEFTDQLRNMGHDALASAPTDADRVDGLRFLLRQLAYREEQCIEFPKPRAQNRARSPARASEMAGTPHNLDQLC